MTFTCPQELASADDQLLNMLHLCYGIISHPTSLYIPALTPKKKTPIIYLQHNIKGEKSFLLSQTHYEVAKFSPFCYPWHLHNRQRRLTVLRLDKEESLALYGAVLFPCLKIYFGVKSGTQNKVSILACPFFVFCSSTYNGREPTQGCRFLPIF